MMTTTQVVRKEDAVPRLQLFNCSYAECGATFTRKWRLKEHETVHTGAVSRNTHVFKNNNIKSLLCMIRQIFFVSFSDLTSVFLRNVDAVLPVNRT